MNSNVEILEFTLPATAPYNVLDTQDMYNHINVSLGLSGCKFKLPGGIRVKLANKKLSIVT